MDINGDDDDDDNDVDLCDQTEHEKVCLVGGTTNNIQDQCHQMSIHYPM